MKCSISKHYPPHCANPTPLTPFYTGPYIGILLKLLRKGADANLSDLEGFTPLHIAARHGHVRVLEELAAAKGKVNFRSKKGEACLHVAAAEGQLQAVKTLLGHGADPNLQTVQVREAVLLLPVPPLPAIALPDSQPTLYFY